MRTFTFTAYIRTVSRLGVRTTAIICWRPFTLTYVIRPVVSAHSEDTTYKTLLKKKCRHCTHPQALEASQVFCNQEHSVENKHPFRQSLLSKSTSTYLLNFLFKERLLAGHGCNTKQLLVVPYFFVSMITWLIFNHDVCRQSVSHLGIWS